MLQNSVERDENGALFAYDSQKGKVYSGKELVDYLGGTNHINALARIDNAIIDVDAASKILRMSF